MKNNQFILNEGYKEKYFDSARGGYLFHKKKKFYDFHLDPNIIIRP